LSRLDSLVILRFYSRNYQAIKVLVFFLIVQIALTFLVPPMISHDGYNYLSSAKSLFTSDFPFRYQLMREPGFPFLIWLAYQTDNVILALALLQSIFLSISATIFFQLFTQKYKLNKKPTLICVLAGLIAIRGYSNNVLQMCVIILIISIMTYYLNWLTNNHNLKYKPFLFAGLIGAASASINSALMCSMIGSLFLAQILLHQHWARVIKIMTSLMIGIGAVLIPWYVTIFPIDVNSQMIPSYHTAYDLKYFESSSFIEDNLIRLQSMGSLLFVYPDRAPGYPTGYSLPAKELMLFGNYWDYGKTGNCFINHGGQKEAVEFVIEDIKPRCINAGVLTMQRTLSRILSPIYLSSGIFFITALLVSIVKKRRHIQLFLLPILILISIYSFGGAGISRFSAILPLIGPLLAFWVWSELRKTIKYGSDLVPPNEMNR
jgi:hypothetical protein